MGVRGGPVGVRAGHGMGRDAALGGEVRRRRAAVRGPGQARPGQARSGRVGSGRVGSGRVGSGRVGSGRVGVGSGGAPPEPSPLAGRAALRACGREVRPAAPFLSLSRQRKEPKKGDPDAAPRCAGFPAVLGPRGRAQSSPPAGARTTAPDGAARRDPRAPALLGAAYGEVIHSARFASPRGLAAHRFATSLPARAQRCAVAEAMRGEPGALLLPSPRAPQRTPRASEGRRRRVAFLCLLPLAKQRN